MTFILHIMRICYYTCVFVGLVFLAACFSGCVTPQSASGGPQPPVESTATPVQTVNTQMTARPATVAAGNGGIDTTINIHYNDYDCLDVTKELGVVYLFPDQKYTIRVSPPNNQVNVNVLLLDVGDREKIQTVKPEWNAIAKTWTYAGLVPLVQFNDVSTTQEKTVTIKNQGKYYLCADDRKESGINDAIIRVPVKVTRA
jgi:hypothetical protein